MKKIVAIVLASLLAFLGCSDSDDETSSPSYIVQATVSVEDDGPVAYALVMDGDKNLVSTLNLTINGDPMNIKYSEDPNGESTEAADGSPYYILDLPELKGGNMVVFEAVDQWGEIIYAPEPAVIPMAIELLDPQEGQEITAGDEVLIRWTGGEGAEVFSAAYMALDGSAMYSVKEAPGGSGSATIPAGQTVQGDAVLGVGAISGDIHVMNSFDDDFISRESYFLVSRETGILTTVSQGESAMLHPQYKRLCPNQTGKQAWSNENARMACMAEFSALGIGAIVWESRRGCELSLSDHNKKYCTTGTNNYGYCVRYGLAHGHAVWLMGCMGCGGIYDEQSGKIPHPFWQGRYGKGFYTTYEHCKR